MKPRLKSSSPGFTIVELMVAMAITTIIVTILITITSIALETWNRSRSELRAARQAQAMTDMMARDFESMVTRSGNTFEWLFAESTNTDGPPGNPSPNSADIIFFTAATDRYDGQIGDGSEDKGGDISTVGYSLRFKDPIDTEGANFETFVLYRKLVDPNETFAGTSDGKPPLLGQNELKSAFSLYQDDIAEAANFVCENIFQFTLILHIEFAEPPASQGDPTIMRNIPFVLTQEANSTARIFGDRMELTPAPDPAEAINGRITAVEVSITVISDNALNALRGPTTISEDFIRKNSYQYSKRIEVPRT